MELERQRRLFAQCDPSEPLSADDARYEPFDDRHLRGEPARRRLHDTIAVRNKPTTQLFMGLLGSGKSTELRRLADDLRRDGYFVANANVAERDDPLLARTRPLTVSDLLMAACLAIDEALAAVRVALRSPLDALWEGLKREITVEPLLALGPLQIRTKFKDEPVFRGQLAQREREAPRAFKAGVNKFIERARSLVREHELGRDLVVVLDGLEKVADIENPEIEAAFRDVFLRNADAVRLPCHAVYPVAPFMVQHSGELGALYDAEPVLLAMVRVRGRNGERDEAGVDGLIAALRLRGLGEAFDHEDTLRDLVLASGGYLRDLFRLVRECILSCPSEAERVDRQLARQAIRRIRRTYREGLFEEYRPYLRVARERKDFELSDASRPFLARLLRAHMLLRYPQRRRVVRRPPAAVGGAGRGGGVRLEAHAARPLQRRAGGRAGRRQP